MASVADARERLTGPPRRRRWLAAVAASLALHAVAWTLLTRLASTRPPVDRPMIVGVVPVTPEALPAGIAEGAAVRRADEDAATARAAREARQAEARRRADEARRAEDARLAAEVRRLAEAGQAEELARPASAPLSHSATGPQPPAAPEGGAFSPGPAARLDPGRAASGTASSGYGGGRGYEPPRSGYEPPHLVARSAVEPQYPPSAYRLGAEGIALVGVAVKPDGTVAKTAIVRSAGHPELDRAALDAVRRWLFEPARRDGAPVAGTVQVPVRFELR